MGIEPTYLAWKASVLPLNYTRICYKIVILLWFSPKRVMGIEPTYPAWKAGVLPLNYTRTACCLCISVASTKISIYDETVFVNTKFKFFSVFLKTYTNYHLADNFVRRIKSSVSLLSSIPNNCYAVYQKELSLLLI